MTQLWVWNSGTVEEYSQVSHNVKTVVHEEYPGNRPSWTKARKEHFQTQTWSCTYWMFFCCCVSQHFDWTWGGISFQHLSCLISLFLGSMLSCCFCPTLECWTFGLCVKTNKASKQCLELPNTLPGHLLQLIPKQNLCMLVIRGKSSAMCFSILLDFIDNTSFWLGQKESQQFIKKIISKHGTFNESMGGYLGMLPFVSKFHWSDRWWSHHHHCNSCRSPENQQCKVCCTWSLWKTLSLLVLDTLLENIR